jgi:hypothetical protein
MTVTRALLFLLAVAALARIEATPADAQTATCWPWCRERSGGGTNCGFVSREQCMLTAYGADICRPNRACQPRSGDQGGRRR